MMKLYDDVIKEILSILQSYSGRDMKTFGQHTWKDVGKEHMILRNDMAYELGGKNLPALGSMMITMEESLVPEDEILLYGKDLGEISGDSAYARIAWIRVKEGSLGEGNDLYNEIRRLEYTKYHLFPEGYMMRISAAGEREMVRIGRQALKKGMGFAEIGNMFLEAYHRNPRTEAVKLIFVTEPEFPYRVLEAQMKKGEQITKAIDHILKDLAMDCNVCSLKQICDEVEGMKELHFGTAKRIE